MAAVAVGLVLAMGAALSTVVVPLVLVALVAFEWLVYWTGDPNIVPAIGA